MKRVIGVVAVILVVIGVVLVFGGFSSGPTFSNTAEWDPTLFERTDDGPTTQIDFNTIVLSPPPSHGSAEEREDIEAVVSAMDWRTDERSQMIIAEMDIQTADYGGFTVAQLLDPENGFASTPALLYAWPDLETIILRQKRLFDRARPHTVDSRIIPLIEVPAHPSYPSGHATQSFFLAYVFSDIFPERRELFFSRAAEIALDREIAGVHFPSDSAAGMELARQYFLELWSDPTFSQLMEEARAAAKVQ